MQMKTLGSTDIQVSTIALGTWAMGGGGWWGKGDDNEAIATVQAALDQGINLIDTAPAYYFGHSETLIGRALKGRRSDAVIATKCGLWWGDDSGPVWFEQEGTKVRVSLEPRTIRIEIEESLQRLDTDYIDLYQTHWPSLDPLKTSIEDTMACLMALRDEGKIRAIGACNVQEAEMKVYQSAGIFSTCQNKYSLLTRDIEAEVQPYCVANNIGILPWSPLEQGLLTGKITMDTVIPAGEFRNEIPWYKPENRQQVINMLDGWKDLIEKYNCTIAQLVIAWTVAQPGVLSVLCGARKVKNITENAKAGSIVLDTTDTLRMHADACKCVLY